MCSKFLSVGELTDRIKATLEAHFGEVCVSGEISNLTKHQSGHYYFSLKDSKASIRCVFFRFNRIKNKLEIENEMSVVISGELSVYELRGEYQINCTKIELAGVGNLAAQYEKLRKKLENKGYFRLEIKKSIPKMPKKIAILTSISGAAICDIKAVANKRWGLAEIIIFDTLVQGIEAKNSIVKNIQISDKMGFDIIVLARGGGSLEDLWAFNEEIVCDAIFNAKTPIVSAIGHESDVVLSDFVSDLRAATPSNAMELILPDRNEWLLRLNEMLDSINRAMSGHFSHKQNEINLLKNSISHFRFDYFALKNLLNDLKLMLDSAFKSLLANKRNKLTSLHFNLGDFFNAKMTNLAILKNALDLHMKNALNKFEVPPRWLLENAFKNLMLKKQNELKNLNDGLNARMLALKPRAGFVQITQNGTMKNLSDLKNGEIVELSDGINSKNAEIL